MHKYKLLLSAVLAAIATNSFAGSIAVVNQSALTTDGISSLPIAAIIGGTIDGTVIGGTTPANGTFTNLNANGLILPGSNGLAPGLSFSSAGSGFFFNAAGFGINNSFDTTLALYVNTQFLITDTNSNINFTVSSATGLAASQNSPPVGDISTTLATTQFTTYGSQTAGSVITVGVSPFAYTCLVKGNLLVTGGVQSAIQLTRAATAYPYGGMLNGSVHCSQNDIITITYTTAPVVDFIPE